MTESNTIATEYSSEVKDTIVVRNKTIPVVTRMVEQARLRFYPDNPRIYSIVRSDEREPSQEEIQARLLQMEHVRELVRDIKRNGGLIDPLIVKDNSLEVLEGNSRLAAYRYLAQGNPITWGFVKCTLLPRDVDESLVFAILGQHHIKGKKDWAPYEQAGFVYRRHVIHKVELDSLSKEIGLTQHKIKHLIETFQFMKDHDQNDVDRWSYYDEYLKSSKIKRARKKYPQLDDIVVEKIESQEISRAVDIRDSLPLVCSGPGKTLKKFVAGSLPFADAIEMAQSAGGDNIYLKRLVSFRKWLVGPEIASALAKIDGQPRKKTVYELEKIHTRAQALHKNLSSSN